MRFDQPLQGGSGALERARVAEQPEVVMGGEDDPEKLEGQLPRIGVRLEMSLVDRDADRFRDRAAQFALPGHEQLAHRAGAIVILGRRCEDKTAAREIAFHPLEPVREEGPETRQAAGLFQCGRENVLEEQRLRLPESQELQLFLGTEVSEQPALGHRRPVGERADAQSLQADLTREGDGLVEDQSARLLAFSHSHIIVRTFVTYNYFFSFGRLDGDLRLHIRIVRSTATLWANPDDVLSRILHVAGLAVNAGLSVDLEPVDAVAAFHEFVHARGAGAAFWRGVPRDVDCDA